jgi:DNA-binding MarR family transcriptional regulator
VRTSSDTRPDLAGHLRHTIVRAARRMRQEAGSDLSPSLTAALSTVERQGPLTPSELAARERIQRPTATRVLARLEEEGLIARTADLYDRRSSLVAITEEGKRLLEEQRTRKTAFLAARLEGLTTEERRTLTRAADILERVLER